MRLKHYIAENLPEAMAKVREDLGPDAIILATDELGEGEGVRVTAGIDEDLEDDLFFQDEAEDIDVAEEITEVLEYHRIPANLIDHLAADAVGIPVQDWPLALAGAFDNLFDFAPIPCRPQPRPLMLVGAPGDGKTATIAKICAKSRLEDQPVSVITIDTEKTGGVEQIAAYCHRLQVALDIAHSPEELKKAVARQPKDHLILIDTMGVNPFDDDAVNELGLFNSAARSDVALVIAAGGDVYEAADKAAAFRALKTKYLIPTKLDTTRRYGGIVMAAHSGHLSLMAAGTSPHIVDGLTPINPVSLARLLLPVKQEPKQPSLATGTR